MRIPLPSPHPSIRNQMTALPRAGCLCSARTCFSSAGLGEGSSPMWCPFKISPLSLGERSLHTKSFREHARTLASNAVDLQPAAALIMNKSKLWHPKTIGSGRQHHIKRCGRRPLGACSGVPPSPAHPSIATTKVAGRPKNKATKGTTINRRRNAIQDNAA